MNLKLVLTDDNRLLPASQVLIPDAPWRLDNLDRTKVKILHRNIPHRLAANAGSRSLLKDVVERHREVQHSKNKEANDWCKRWQDTLKSPEFKDGLKRLILDERDISFIVRLEWLERISVFPANKIVTDLFLDNYCIASDVPGNYYFEDEKKTFYLRLDKKTTMRQYLADSLNKRLADDNCKLADRAQYLVTMLDEEPTDIESFLDNQNIRTLQGELPQIDWHSNDQPTSSISDEFNFADGGNDNYQDSWEESQSLENDQEAESFIDDVEIQEEKETNYTPNRIYSDQNSFKGKTTAPYEITISPQYRDSNTNRNTASTDTYKSASSIKSTTFRTQKSDRESSSSSGTRKRQAGDYDPPDFGQDSEQAATTTNSDLKDSNDFYYPTALEKVFQRPGKTNLNSTEPRSSVPNPQQRRQKIRERIQDIRRKESLNTERVKIVEILQWESKNEEVRIFLREVYGGECQICSYTFPKQDGEPYFEAVYLSSRTLAGWIDQPGNVLCLCANCCAKFKHGSVKAENIREQIKLFQALNEGGQEEYVLRIELCGKPEEIRFHESHMMEVQELLRVAEREGNY